MSISIHVEAPEFASAPCLGVTARPPVCSTQQPSLSVTTPDMATTTERLECPLCDFTVLPSDDYVLRLHFEQLHTTDSPFIIEDDPEPLPPPLPPRPDRDSAPASDDEAENSVFCSVPDCGELVSLEELNEHLDYHAAESLSFDETTGEYVFYGCELNCYTRQRDIYSQRSGFETFWELY